MTDSFAVAEPAPNAHALAGCGGYLSGTVHVMGAAINSHSRPSCPFTLAVTPNATVFQEAYTNLVFEAWSNKGPKLSFDNATVEFVVGEVGAPYFTKTTAEYSIIAYHSTFDVFLEPDDFVGVPPDAPELNYAATITTADSLVYSMTGLLYFQVAPPLVPPAELTGVLEVAVTIGEIVGG